MIRMAFAGSRLSQGAIALDPSEAHYLRQVMRLGGGEPVEALVEGTGLFLAQLSRDGTTLAVSKTLPMPPAPALTITLCPALIKHDLLSEVIEKGTEVGIAGFEPWVGQRSLVRNVSANKLERWQKIAKEASEQSRRTSVPEFHPVKPEVEALRLTERELGIVWDPQGMSLRTWWTAQDHCERVKTVVGPEGGITPRERETLVATGFQPVALGPQIYRAENAGVFGALLLHFLSTTGKTRLP